jgi:hypothetical protein
MIPSNLESGLTAAWREGGLHLYCHLQALWEWAIRARDYALAATVDWLFDVADIKTDQTLRRT